MAFSYGRDVSLLVLRPLIRVPAQTPTPSPPSRTAEEIEALNSRMENIQAGVEEMQKMFRISLKEAKEPIHDDKSDQSGVGLQSPDQCDGDVCDIVIQPTGANDLIMYSNI
jgi:hypothetical protein